MKSISPCHVNWVTPKNESLFPARGTERMEHGRRGTGYVGEKKQKTGNILSFVSICILAKEEVPWDASAQVRSGSLPIPFSLANIYRLPLCAGSCVKYPEGAAPVTLLEEKRLR